MVVVAGTIVAIVPFKLIDNQVSVLVFDVSLCCVLHVFIFGTVQFLIKFFLSRCWRRDERGGGDGDGDALMFVKGTRSSRGVGFDFAGGDGIVGIVMGWSGGGGIGAGSLPKTGLACPICGCPHVR